MEEQASNQQVGASLLFHDAANTSHSLANGYV